MAYLPLPGQPPEDQAVGSNFPLGEMLEPRPGGMSQQGTESIMRGLGINKLTPEELDRLNLELRPPAPQQLFRPGERVPLPQARGVLEGERDLTAKRTPEGLTSPGLIPPGPRDRPRMPLQNITPLMPHPDADMARPDQRMRSPDWLPPRSEINPMLLQALFGRG